MALRTTWNAFPSLSGASKQDVIASRSTNKHWDDAFSQTITLAAGVQLDSARKNNYLAIGRTAAIVNAGTTTKGSFFFMARKINAGNYPNVVAPMMSTMAKAIAALAGAAITAGPVALGAAQ